MDASDRTRRPGTILFLHPSDEGYGADRSLLEFLLGLVRSGWRPIVLLPDDTDPGWLSVRLADAGIPVRRGPLAVARRRYLSLRAAPRYVRSIWRARSFVRGQAIGSGALVIHLNTSALLVGSVLGRPGGARVVWHVHEIVMRPRSLALLFRLVPALTADLVIAVSDAVRRHVTPRGWFRHRVIVVRNGIASRPPPGRNPGRSTVAFVGRLNRWKGYELFVDAVRQVAVQHPAARFVIAGDPPTGEEWRTDELVSRIAAAGLTSTLEYQGFVPDGSTVFEQADIAVVPSTWPDPLPTVVLEAMRAGCAVVAADHGGAPEMIEDGVSGVLVKPGDANALAEAIGSLLQDADRRSALGSAARARIRDEFSVDASLDALERAYRSVLADAAQG